ncbi:hypothetical protein PM082_001339 [Marasmius tenuissimus]|nr:hypothetical protein PM082_001339 [Marasmius tenuissimus]
MFPASLMQDHFKWSKTSINQFQCRCTCRASNQHLSSSIFGLPNMSFNSQERHSCPQWRTNLGFVSTVSDGSLILSPGFQVASVQSPPAVLGHVRQDGIKRKGLSGTSD